MKEVTLIIFQHIVNNSIYCWNGKYPIRINIPEGDVWNEHGDISEKEVAFFQKLETSKQRGFEIKGRGKYNIVKRIKLET